MDTNLFVNLLLGLVPIIWLVIALTGLKMPGYKACGIAIALAAVEIGRAHV